MGSQKFLCFDCDGVVVDNTLNAFGRINSVLWEIGLKPVEEKFLREHWGMKSDELISFICRLQGASNPQNIIKVIADFKKAEETIKDGAKIDRRLVKVLGALPDFGFFPALVTSRTRESLERYAEDIDLDLNLFLFIQTASDYPVCKPNGSVFKPLIQWAYNCDQTATAANITYFGDTLKYDYQAVLNARMQQQMIKFVGVCSGVNSYEEFINAGLNEQNVIVDHGSLKFYLNRIIQENIGASPTEIYKITKKRIL
jgi:phosphoglycolate phosphatase-like HAD superfamily hydrolase